MNALGPLEGGEKKGVWESSSKVRLSLCERVEPGVPG